MNLQFIDQFFLPMAYALLQLVVLEDEGDKNDVLRQKRGGQKQYVYDVVFGEDATQVRKIIFFHFIATQL
jgi:hypothetical protein